MELDEMKAAWQALDRRLEQQQRLNAQLYRADRIDRLRHGLRPLVWGQSIQILFGVFFMLMGIDFWTTHTHALHTMLNGVSVQIFGMLMIGFSARVLHFVQRIDYALPVLDIQRTLAELRAWRVRVEAPIFTIVGSFIWIPLVLILIQWDWDLMGGDFWDKFPDLAPNLMLSGMASLILAAIVYVLLRRAGCRRWLENNFAGSSVRKAEALLDEITKFEREGG